MQRRIFTTLLLLSLFSFSKASHYMGVDMSFECLTACTYRIYNYTYYDCTGAATPLPPNTPPAPSISFTSSPANCQPTQPAAIGGWTFISYEEVTPVCPTASTGCTVPGSAINGVLGAGYYIDYDFCNSNCNTYTISWSNCCRNYAITSGAQGNSIYSGSTIIDLTISPCNSSPVFQNPPIPYICAGQPFTFNQGAYDADGDSLSYSLGPCYQSATQQVTYNAGYSATSPLGPGWLVTVNPSTGDVTFTPNPTGPVVVGVMCVYVTEWRNGIQIGQISRDMQITVINCQLNQPQTTGIQNYNVNGIPGAPLSFSTADACAGVPVCFDIGVLPQFNATSGANTIYTMYWDHGVANGIFYDLNNPAVQDTIVGDTITAHFCFTPPSPGIYSYVVTVSDDNCPIQGFNQFTVQIFVYNNSANANATATYVNCNQVEFTAFPDPNSTGPFDFTWLGTGNVNNTTDSSYIHTYPAPGFQTWQCTIIDTFGCVSVIDGSINVPNGAIADAGPDFAICSGFTNIIGTTPLANQTYNWSPATGLSSTTSANPNVSLINNTGAPMVINYTLEAIASQCTTYDYVTVTILPAPAVSIAPANPVICLGDSVWLVASGGSTYLWNNGSGNDSILVQPSFNSTYSVTSFSNGCASPPVDVTVQVTPGPVGNISGTLSVCQGASTTLTANGGTSYIWNNGNNTGSLTLNPVNANVPVWMIPSVGLCKGDTIFAEVVANPNPVAGFTSSLACAGSPTVFTDLSNISSGNIIGWDWDFGDPSSLTNSSVAQSPTHTYMQNGVFNTSLTVISENGCTNTVNLPVNVAAIPNVDFTFANVCEGYAPNFINQTTIANGNNIVSYVWDYGDGNLPDTVLTNASVSHTYATFGFYNVNLTAVSDNGCVESFTKTVFIHPKPDASFLAPSECLVDAMQFVNTSSVEGNLDNVSTYSWSFGDPASGASNFSNLQNPAHLFTSPGQHMVTLMIGTNNGCRDTVVLPVTVFPQPVADFTVDKRCANEVAEFRDLSTVASATAGVSGWYWTLGLPDVASSVQNPIFDYGSEGPGVYTVTLIATTDDRCADTVTHNITINPVPVTSFDYDKVCLHDTTKFYNTSTILSGNITEYNWVLDNNPLITSNSPNPSYVYLSDGGHWVNFTTISDSGCVESIRKAIYVNPLPELPLISNDTVCLGQAAVLGIEPQSINTTVRWYYSLTDTLTPFYTGNSFVTEHLPFPVTYYVQLTTGNGCKGGLLPVSGVMFSDEDIELIASETEILMPSAPVHFSTNSSVNLVSWNWNFGDGNTSLLAEPTHEYQYPDVLTVHLQTTDENGCIYNKYKTLEVKRVVTLSAPSVFSPNGDGYNDFFSIGYYNINNFLIQVYDRWGGLVYESSNPQFQWDGKDIKKGKDLPEGVYVYVVKGIAFDGNKTEKSGTVTIVR
ncbi:MAG: PKD domain-containing protein [Bacteroidia bacterium]|nr:PKD domain-containing protein [Bacteroidia bacterium]